MRFSLLVTELYLRNRVSDHYVSASSRPAGLRVSHEESMIQLPSHSIVHRSKSLYYTLSAVDVILSLLTFLINTSRYSSTTTDVYVGAA